MNLLQIFFSYWHLFNINERINEDACYLQVVRHHRKDRVDPRGKEYG